VTEGDNCNACTKIDGKIFSIAQAEQGKTLAPFHPNCNCKTAILNQNNDVSFFVDDIVKMLMEAFDFSKPWERDFSANRVHSVSEEEAVYLAQLQYKMVLEGMTVEQYEYLTGNA